MVIASYVEEPLTLMLTSQSILVELRRLSDDIARDMEFEEVFGRLNKYLKPAIKKHDASPDIPVLEEGEQSPFFY